MAIEMPPLPYERTALEPHISGETLDYHHGKHHKAYVDNLNRPLICDNLPTPMEFGFLNAILRSPVMPPLDPFFSGGYINYYYYGLYLVSLPIKATGIDPAIGFNLVIPTLFGLTLAGGYAIIAQLTGRVPAWPTVVAGQSPPTP